jgi:hypothetical protein
MYITNNQKLGHFTNTQNTSTHKTKEPEKANVASATLKFNLD